MAYLNLVVGGPSNAAAWGVNLTSAEVDHQLRYSVKLFLHGIVPQRKVASESAQAAGIEDERRELDGLLKDTIDRLAELRGRLGE